MKLKFFDLARKLSKKSNHHQHKLGCVIVKRNRIIGLGFNQIKTHTKSNNEFKMLHAEISALLGISYEDLDGCDVYIYREHKNSIRAMAKPCSACEQALKMAGIKRVFFTIEDDYGCLDLRKL